MFRMPVREAVRYPGERFGATETSNVTVPAAARYGFGMKPVRIAPSEREPWVEISAWEKTEPKEWPMWMILVNGGILDLGGED